MSSTQTSHQDDVMYTMQVGYYPGPPPPSLQGQETLLTPHPPTLNHFHIWFTPKLKKRILLN